MGAPAPQQRDGALRRVSRVTWWTVAGALGLTGAFSAYVASALPGSSASQPAGAAPATSPTTAPAVAPSPTGGSALPAPTAPTRPPVPVIPLRPITRSRGS